MNVLTVSVSSEVRIATGSMLNKILGCHILLQTPPSNASVSGFELVMFIRHLSCYSCNVIMCLGLTVSVSSEVRIATGSMLRSVEPVIYKISFL
jgi:hypothetical protein